MMGMLSTASETWRREGYVLEHHQPGEPVVRYVFRGCGACEVQEGPTPEKPPFPLGWPFGFPRIVGASPVRTGVALVVTQTIGGFSTSIERWLVGNRDAWSIGVGERAGGARAPEVLLATADLTCCVLEGPNQRLSVLHRSGGAPVELPVTTRPRARMDLAPDGRHLVTAERGARVRVWDTATAHSVLDVRLEAATREVRFEGFRVVARTDHGGISLRVP